MLAFSAHLVLLIKQDFQILKVIHSFTYLRVHRTLFIVNSRCPRNISNSRTIGFTRCTLQNLPDDWIRPLYPYKTFPTIGFTPLQPQISSRRLDSPVVPIQNLPDDWIHSVAASDKLPTTGFARCTHTKPSRRLDSLRCTPLPQASRLWYSSSKHAIIYLINEP